MQYDNVDFETAARGLDCWDETSTINAAAARAHRAERERERQRIADREAADRDERFAACNWLHAMEALYREACEAHDWDLMAEFLPLVRSAENHYCQLAALEVPYGG